MRRPAWCKCSRGCGRCPHIGTPYCGHTEDQPYRFRTKKCRDAFEELIQQEEGFAMTRSARAKRAP